MRQHRIVGCLTHQPPIESNPNRLGVAIRRASNNEVVSIESEIPVSSHVIVANHDITATGVAVLHHAAANWNHSPVTRRGRQVNSPDYLDCIITNTRDDLGLTEPRNLELKSAHPAELLKFLPHDEA